MRKEDIYAGIVTFFVATSLNHASNHPEVIREHVDVLNNNKVLAMPRLEELSPTTQVKISK